MIKIAVSTEKEAINNGGYDFAQPIVSEDLNKLTRIAETSLVTPELNQVSSPIASYPTGSSSVIFL